MIAIANRRLGVFSLATLLVSAHYGLGFLLGTAEQAMTRGAGGSLYAVSVGLGTLVTLALAKFYWSEVEQIWTLLGNRYGKLVKVGVGFMSWVSLVGIEAVQIIAATSILKVAGVPTVSSMVILTLMFFILSLLPIEKASWIFRGLLLLNILSLIYALAILHGLPEYGRLSVEFIPTLAHIPASEAIGVSLSTILLVLIDMKCQQFIIQAKDINTAYLGCILAALALIVLAFLPAAVVVTAQNANILPLDLMGKEAIPYVLAWIGGGADHPWGIFLTAALAVPALGLGSSILRIQNKTVLDLEVIPDSAQNYILVAATNALLALVIAFKGGEIVSLILCFYAAYLSTVWIPFIAYLLVYAGVYTFSKNSVRLSLVMSSLAAVSTLCITLLQPEMILFNSPELTIMSVGLGVGGLSLLGIQVTEKYVPVPKTQKD